MRSVRHLRNLTILLIVFGLGFAGGALVTRYPGAATRTILPDILAHLAPGASLDGQTFRTVWNKLHGEYVSKNVNDEDLIVGAIKGMVDAVGDPYTNFLTKSEAREFQEEISGSFEGIGMEIGRKNGRLTVIAPLVNSPSAKAGILPGDVVLSIDGVDAESLTIDEAVKKIRGPKGTTVRLTMLRGESEPITFNITRATIQIDAVVPKIVEQADQKISVIQLTGFSTNTSLQFRQAAVEGIRAGVAGFVIDLRNNPGGYLSEAVKVASVVIPSGIVVYEEDREGARDSLSAEGNAILSGQRIVVLINAGSASASEIVAGALQDAKAATIMGEKSFGKGTVQELQTLDDGSNLKITIARWLTPSGRSITDQGIEPDVRIEMTDADVNAKKDPQLDAAIKHLLSGN